MMPERITGIPSLSGEVRSQNLGAPSITQWLGFA
jgi:hypothetical protein